MQLRRPLLHDKTQVYLRLETSFGKWRIPLTGKQKAAGIVVPLPARVDWRENEWVPVLLDLMKLLKPKLEAHKRWRKHKGAVHVTEMRLMHLPANRAHQLHVKNVTVFKRTQKDDVIRMNAYDASGIAGVRWEYRRRGKVLKQGRTDKTEFRLAALGLPRAPGWLHCRAVDRAGNESSPVVFPLWP